MLASWASDACAVEAAPGLRQPPTGPNVAYDEIMGALRLLDKGVTQQPPNYEKLVTRARRLKDVVNPRGQSDIFGT